MINGLPKIGIIEMLSQALSNFLGSSPLDAAIMMMWLSGIIPPSSTTSPSPRLSPPS